MRMDDGILPSSFRDPSGFLFAHEGSIYRQINHCYKEHFDHLIASGLYSDLVNRGLLIPHEEVNLALAKTTRSAWKVIRPEPLPFVSYPYEWCFSQLKDAALLTLEIQRISFQYGMSLKDCSAYNVQFYKGRPIFIDTLSFEKYREGAPWVAYRQFCQHFLAPLALASLRDIRLNQLLRVHIDGIPLDFASKLLPFRSYLSPFLVTHIRVHARAQKHFSGKPENLNKRRMQRSALRGLIDNLESCISRLRWKSYGTEWGDYYENTNYSLEAFTQKKETIRSFLQQITPKPRIAWDLGANTGVFSRLASEEGILTIAAEFDPVCVEQNYRECVTNGEEKILPLNVDLINPSPASGWANQERLSLLERGPADVALALALVHHLAISNNVPFDRIARFFSRICNWLIIEFVPKSDSQVQRLLSSREDIFQDYNQQAFEDEFTKHYGLFRREYVEDLGRVLYLMGPRN